MEDEPKAVQEIAKARAMGINHVVLEVDDVDAALEFYGCILDFSVRSRSPHSAFVDMGDQFLALVENRTQGPDKARHFGLVVDNRESVRHVLEQMDVELLPGGGLDFLDPWGNRVQVVDYRNIQFMKDPQVLQALGLGKLKKSDRAKQQLADKGIVVK